MKDIIKKILKESTLNRGGIVDKVYNHIKDDFWIEHNKNFPDGQVMTSFHTPEGEQIKGERGGISAQLGDDFSLARNFAIILFDMAKDRFIYGLPWVLYEDYIQYQEDPYIMDSRLDGGDEVFNLRKIEGLKKFLEWLGEGVNVVERTHYNATHNYLDSMTPFEYRMLHKDLMSYIERDLHL
jgi:hypothetical protein